MGSHFKCLLIILLLLPLTIFGKSSIRYDITGLSGEMLKNSLAALQNAEKTIQASNKTLTPAAIERLYSQGDETIRKALQPYGYFSPSIRSSLEKKDTQTILHYQVNPGPSLNITQLDLQITGAGANDPVFTLWRNKFPLKIGQIFNAEKYNDAKQSFFTVANDNGYIKAKIKQQKVHINLDSYEANIALHFDTGTRYFYGPISFSKVPLKESFLRRYLNIKTGQPYSLGEILKLQQNLSSSGYFKSVSIHAEPQKAKNNHIPLHVKLKLQKRMRYTIGVGYGTDTGYRARLGWQWRRINAYGHHMDTEYNISQIGNLLGINYYIPGADPLNEQYRFSANRAYYETDAGTSKIQSYGGMFIKSKNHWQINYGITYQAERYQLKNQQEQTARLLMPSTTLMYLKTDNVLRPSYGRRFSINLRGAKKNFFSNIDFAQIRIQLRNLIRLNENNRLFLRLDLGATYVSDYDNLPLSLRFTAGGTQSVRGYRYQSLGPGKYLLTNTLELQHRIKGNWFVGIFHDIGNAFNDISHPKLQNSAGIGLIWQSPIGTMELDLAKSLSQHHQKPILQFSIGALL